MNNFTVHIALLFLFVVVQPDAKQSSGLSDRQPADISIPPAYPELMIRIDDYSFTKNDTVEAVAGEPIVIIWEVINTDLPVDSFQIGTSCTSPYDVEIRNLTKTGFTYIPSIQDTSEIFFFEFVLKIAENREREVRIYFIVKKPSNNKVVIDASACRRYNVSSPVYYNLIGRTVNKHNGYQRTLLLSRGKKILFLRIKQ